MQHDLVLAFGLPARLSGPGGPLVIGLAAYFALLAIGLFWLRRRMGGMDSEGARSVSTFDNAEARARATFKENVLSLRLGPGEALHAFREHRKAFGRTEKYSQQDCRNAIRAGVEARKKSVKGWFGVGAFAVGALTLAALVALS